jgi:pyridoxine kinase
MFAALTIPRLIEAVQAKPDLSSKPSWRSPDEVPADELPLAKACQKVLASMQAILGRTTEICQERMAEYDTRVEKEGRGEGDEATEERAKRRHLALMNASEVKVIRYVRELHEPPHLERFQPRKVEEGLHVPDKVTEKKPDGLNVLHLGVGPEGEGAFQVEATKQDRSAVESVEGEMQESGLKEIQPNILESKEAHVIKEEMRQSKS